MRNVKTVNHYKLLGNIFLWIYQLTQLEKLECIGRTKTQPDPIYN